VQLSGAGQNLGLTLLGSGFGPAPVQMPYSGDLFQFGIVVFHSDNQGPGIFGAGYSGNNDSVTLNYNSWSDQEIKVDGFSGDYGASGTYGLWNAEGSGNWIAAPGDVITLTVMGTASGLPAAWSGRL
ncbi:MAG: hypothetical protein LC772_10140, partial [Chloroflexi bacterium]|nr:hypothetical protein [Chloroflexota bacterium]